MIEFTDRGMRIGDEEYPLYSGAIHYWRHKKERWPLILDRVKEMGFSFVETYIPWSVHEYQEGYFDFGEIDQDKDLGVFLELCREKGLFALVRPGPHINAEMTDFGYPRWILMDEEIQARTASGTPAVYPYVSRPFPIPSYASDKLYEKFAVYLDQVSAVVKEHIWPAGNVVGIQVDNETCYFFRDRPYALDYCRDARRQYRGMLQEKYGSVERLNEVYRTSYGSFQEIEPPAGFETREKLPYYFDWVLYKEYQILKGLERLAEMTRERFGGLAMFHNCAYQNYTPISLQRIEQIEGIGAAGIDVYIKPQDSPLLRERIRYMAGSSRFPFVPEFGSGSWFDRGEVLTPAEQEFTYLYSFMNGLKGINYYMLADRDRWFGCPITEDGDVRTEYFRMFSRMNRMLKKHEVHTYKRQLGVLLLKNYDMGRLKALASEGDGPVLSSNCFVQGFDLPAVLFAREDVAYLEQWTENWSGETWIDEAADSLDRKRVDYDYSDIYIPEQKLHTYARVYASTYDIMETEDQKKLIDYVRRGGDLIIGPVFPQRNKEGMPARELEYFMEENERGKGSIRLISQVSAMEKEESGEYASPVWSIQEEIETSVHRREESELIFIANTVEYKVNARIYFDKPRRIAGIWGCSIEGRKEYLDLEVEGFTVCLLKGERVEDD